MPSVLLLSLSRVCTPVVRINATGDWLFVVTVSARVITSFVTCVLFSQEDTGGPVVVEESYWMMGEKGTTCMSTWSGSGANVLPVAAVLS